MKITRNNIYNFINKLDDEYKKLLQDEIIIDEVILKEPMLSVGKRGYENKILEGLQTNSLFQSSYD